MSNCIDIAVIRPPIDTPHRFSRPYECLAIGYLASALRMDGHRVTMLDGQLYNWTDEALVEAILALSPALAAFTETSNHYSPRLQRIIGKLRGAGYEGAILLGGHAISFASDRVLAASPGVDGVCCGEGEVAVREAAQQIAAGRQAIEVAGIRTRSPNSTATASRRISNLDDLAWPARDLMQDIIQRDGVVCLSSSRGCYARCTFCSVPRFYGLSNGRAFANGGWLARSVDSVVAEIEALHETFGVRELLFVDDEFFGGGEIGQSRAISLAKKLQELALPISFGLSCRAENVDASVFDALKRAGLRHVFLGLEAGNNEDLKLYAKGISVFQNKEAVRTLKRIGLSVQAGFILFHYRSTPQRIVESLEFLAEIGELKPLVVSTVLDPHFGAPITQDVAKLNLLDDDGTQLNARFLNARVAVLFEVAQLCAHACEPFTALISRLQSSITFEWRRIKPRSVDDQRIVEAFEQAVNDGFGSIILDLARRTTDGIDIDLCDLRLEAVLRIKELEERLALGKSLTLEHLSRQVDGLSIVRHRDLIEVNRE